MKKLVKHIGDNVMLLIPENFKVAKEQTGFYASSKIKHSSIAIDVNIGDDYYESALRRTKEPLAYNPFLVSKIIISESKADPCEGWIRIVEHTIVSTGEINHAIEYLGILPSNYYFSVMLCAEGKYEEFKLLWDQILNSIEFVPRK